MPFTFNDHLPIPQGTWLIMIIMTRNLEENSKDCQEDCECAEQSAMELWGCMIYN